MTPARSKWSLAYVVASLDKIIGMARTLDREMNMLASNAPAHVLAALNSEPAFEFDGMDLAAKMDRLADELAIRRDAGADDDEPITMGR